MVMLNPTERFKFNFTSEKSLESLLCNTEISLIVHCQQALLFLLQQQCTLKLPSDICQRLLGRKIWVCPGGIPLPVPL